MLNVILDCLGHLKTTSNNPHIHCIQVALKIDPLIGLAIECLAVELVLADEELVVWFVKPVSFTAMLGLVPAWNAPLLHQL